jgi:hypothetical protein
MSLRSKQAHNNDKEGFMVPVLDFCNKYGISTLDLTLNFNKAYYERRNKEPRRDTREDKPITERRLLTIGEINHNIVKRTITVPTTEHFMNFDECIINTDRLNKEV